MIEKKDLICFNTGNPSGTDTWMVGKPCQCINCQKYVLLLSMEELRKTRTEEENKLIDLIVEHSVAYHVEEWDLMHKAIDEIFRIFKERK